MTTLYGLWQAAQNYLSRRPKLTNTPKSANEFLLSAELILNRDGFVHTNSPALQTLHQTIEVLNTPRMVGEPHANYVRYDETDRRLMHFVSIVTRDNSQKREADNFDIIYTTLNTNQSSSFTMPIGAVSLVDFVQSSLPPMQILSESAAFAKLKLNATTAVSDSSDQPILPSDARYRPGITPFNSPHP